MAPIPTVALLCVVLSAGAYDLRFRRIPNWITFSGVVLGLSLNAMLYGAHGVASAGCGLLCAAIVYLPLYLVRGMGAGDVKLMAAVGAIAGPHNWIEIFFATALIGGIVSLALIAYKQRLHQTLSNLALITGELSRLRAPSGSDARLDVRHSQAVGLPHGAVIATGCIIFLVFRASGWA